MLRLFNLDLHVSVIEDVRSICKVLFGDRIEITNWSLSLHNHLFQKPDKEVKGITQENWMEFSQTHIDEFHEAYDTLMNTFDGFIVTHTPVFAMLFEKYGKPILCINSCRFDQPFCIKRNDAMKEIFLTTLQRMIQKQQLTLISNNHSDEMYCYKQTGLSSIVLPSLCFYTQALYEPTKPQFICYGDRKQLPECKLLIERPSTGYTWKDLHSYKGIVHFPYEMSTMSIFEQYWTGVPLFFPTKHFYKDLLYEGNVNLVSSYSYDENDTMTEQEVDFWLHTSDVYRLPYTYTFSSYDELIKMLINFTDDDREKRIEWIRSQCYLHLERWKTIFQRVFAI